MKKTMIHKKSKRIMALTLSVLLVGMTGCQKTENQETTQTEIQTNAEAQSQESNSIPEGIPGSNFNPGNGEMPDPNFNPGNGEMPDPNFNAGGFGMPGNEFGTTGESTVTGTGTIVDASELINTSFIVADTNDLTMPDFNMQSATKVTLNGNSANIVGDGCELDGTSIVIKEAGTYVFSGTLGNGGIIVKADKESVVYIVLNGVTITNPNSAAIYSKKSLKTILVLADGTTNTLTDGENYVFDSEEAEEPSATIYSKTDLTITGAGTLTIHANYKDAIKCKDSLKLLGGTYEINAVEDGIIGKDFVWINDGIYQITAGKDGIKSTNDSDETLGFVAIDNGTFTLTTGNDGIQAETALMIAGGTYSIVTGGGSANASAHAADNFGGFGGRGGFFGGFGSTTTTETTSESSKGLKAGVCVQISGGTFNINACDDAIHANQSVEIKGGTVEISTGDDGVHADDTLLISDGTVVINKSYEGLEANYITISGGDVTVNASDDGINASDGSGESMGFGGFGGFGGSSSSAMLTITGGVVHVIAQGDGLDSNGSMLMEGGTVYVDGPTDSGNGGLDYDSTFTLNGGLLVVSGSTGMAQAPSTNSSQASISLTFQQNQSAGTKIVVKDSKGNVLIDYAPSKSFQNIVLSASGMKAGESYTVSYNSTEIGTIELASTVTYLSSNGTVSSGSTGMGGMMGGHGGMGGQTGEQGKFPGGMDGNQKPGGRR